jgi:hypothetical protein
MIQEAMSLMGGKGGGGMPDVSALAGMMGAGGNGSSSSGRGGAREPFKGFADEDAWNNPREDEHEVYSNEWNLIEAEFRITSVRWEWKANVSPLV